MSLESTHEFHVRLQWSEISPPNAECCYTHTKAETPFGAFLMTWKGWKQSPDYGFDETPWGERIYNGWDTIEDAKKWAADEMRRRIELCSGKSEQRPGVTDEMVSRFLRWRLPATFNPDGGVSFDKKDRDPNSHWWPVGTNILNAEEAREMLAHILGLTPRLSGSAKHSQTY